MNHLSDNREQFFSTQESFKPLDQEQREDVLTVYVEQDRITFVRETPQTWDANPPPPERRSLVVAAIFLLLLVAITIGSFLAPQPDTSKTFSITVQGYNVAPVHKSRTLTAQATGKGYIPATDATGTLTFYNGLDYPQVVPAGMMLKGNDGVVVVTDEAATIPPVANTIPPTDGETSVPAHALTPGTMGNIVAGDINRACCATAIIAQNPSAFSRGKDAEHFTFVTKQDISHAVNPLLTQLESNVPHLFTSIALSPTCTPTVAATPPVGQRAEQVHIIATVSCTAVSYAPERVMHAIQSYRVHFGQGTFTNIAYQVIAIDRKERVTFFVIATWTPFVARHLWTGK